MNIEKFRLGKLSTTITYPPIQELEFGVCGKCDFIYESLVDFHFSDCINCGYCNTKRKLTYQQFLEFLGDLRIKKINAILENG